VGKATFFLAVAISFIFSSVSSAATVTFTNRASFQATLGSSVIDTYENTAYLASQNDAQMSAVLGETDYQATGFTNLDMVLTNGGTNHAYCSGCNGSFILTFTSTTVGDASGVFGVGIDILDNQVHPFTAFVTFGDNSTADFALPIAEIGIINGFFGITDAREIKSINFAISGVSSNVGGFEIDNLTIGSQSGVPEPATLSLVGGALLVTALVGRRRLLLGRQAPKAAC
jgi:hypothetical protein